MLALLSGRAHRVLTAVAVIAPGRARRPRGSARPACSFKRLTDAEIDAYLASGEWRGKAGGYGVQGRAGAFVIALNGSYTGVVGLPLYETRALLVGLGYPAHDRAAGLSGRRGRRDAGRGHPGRAARAAADRPRRRRRLARRWAPRSSARVRKVERALALAFLDLGAGPDAVLNLRPEMARIAEGQALAVEIRTEARGGKGARCGCWARRRARRASPSPRRPSRTSWPR